MSDKTYGRDILSAVTSGLIGSVPIFGDFLNGTTGLLKQWNTDRKKQAKWHNLHVAMQQYVKMQIEEAKSDAIEKELRGFDENLHQIFADYDRLRDNSAAVSEVQARLAALIDRIRAFQPKLYEDEMYTYATAPFLEHFFLDYLVALVTADLIGAKSHDFGALRQQLYLDTKEYLELAITGVAKERGEDINTRSGPNSNPINYDARTKLDLSEHYNMSHPSKLLPCSQRAAAVVGAAQLMRIPVMNLSTAIRHDEIVKRNVIKSDIFKNVYSEKIRKLHSDFTSVWVPESSYWNDPNFKSWKEVYGKLHADHGKVAETRWVDKYSDCSNSVVGTVFDIPGGREFADYTAPPVTGPKPTSLVSPGSLESGTTSDRLTSPNGKYVVTMQHDGNLVVYATEPDGQAIWSSKTNGKGVGPYRCTMQDDGNLVLKDSRKSEHWASGTWGNGASEARMQDDGNFVIYAKGKATWSSKEGKR